MPVAVWAQVPTGIPDMKAVMKAICLPPQSPRGSAPFVLRVAGLAPTGGELVFGMLGASNGVPIVDLMKSFQAPPRGVGKKGSDARLQADGGVRNLLEGDVDSARQSMQDCVATAAALELPEADGACSGNLGVLLALQGESGAARAQFERSRDRYADWASRLRQLAEKAPSQPLMRRQQTERRQLLEQGPRIAAAGQLRALLNMGNLAAFDGRLALAEADFLAAAALPWPADAPADCGRAARFDLARLHHRMGADDPSDRLPDVDTLEEVTSPVLMAIEPATVVLGSASGTVPELAAGRRTQLALFDDPAWRMLGFGLRPPQAPLRADRSPWVRTDAVGRRSDDALQELARTAQAADAAGQRDAAIEVYAVLTLRAAASGRREAEAFAEVALMRLWAQARQPAPAIFHGKRAVNLLEQVRVGLAEGEQQRAAQRAYLLERAQVYVRLAQLLLDDRRLPEAEEVLRLLKADEGRQFELDRVRRNRPQLSLGAAEAAAADRLDRAVRALRAADAARRVTTGYEPAARMLMNVVRDAGPDQVERERIAEGRQWRSGLESLIRGPTAGAEEPQGPGLDALRAVQAAALIERFEHLVQDAPRFRHVPIESPELARWETVLREAKARQAERASAPPSSAAGGISMPSPRDAFYAALAAGGLAVPPGSPWEVMWRADDAFRTTETAVARDEKALPRELAGAPAAIPAGEDSTRWLATHAPDSALLYYLPDERRLDVLLVARGKRETWRLDVNNQQLKRRVTDLVAQLRDRRSDPRGAAQALHRIMLAPILPALQGAGVNTLVLSLSGYLRYLPFGTLHDGQQWLAERYAVALLPGGRIVDDGRPVTRPWRIGAFGASDGGANLPGVERELAAIVRRPGEVSSGVLPGSAWLNARFTADALRAELEAGTPVVHIASHFVFVGGSAASSYLLLGDGGRLSLAELAGSGFRFDRTELVTLSACETGLSEVDRYGLEIDGLGALLIGQGAPSVLASMWKVDDASTAMMMATLYRVHEEEGGAATRAKALQRAQVALMQGTPSATSGAEARGATRVDPVSGSAPWNGGGRAPYSHPYHWAPFVLMGDWR